LSTTIVGVTMVSVPTSGSAATPRPSRAHMCWGSSPGRA
jgi:hypothetical protein